mgnify:CR=1 FL=1
MLFTQAPLLGVTLIEPELFADHRGSFFRTFCVREFEREGLPVHFVQNSISTNRLQGTIRGMHFQKPPSKEGKLVRCIKGRILDVAVDLRQDSPSYCQWVAYELDSATGKSVYLPPGIAHGFQTLEDNADVLYQMTEFYRPEMDSGVRWNDSQFGVQWPLEATVISDKDQNFEDYKRQNQ